MNEARPSSWIAATRLRIKRTLAAWSRTSDDEKSAIEIDASIIHWIAVVNGECERCIRD